MTYIKLNRESQDIDWILNKRPTAFLLLTIIARRAKRTDDHPNKSLEIGESFIGDYESYGVTKQVYRSDKKFLQSCSQVTLKVTNKGTIAKLTSTSIFDINETKSTDNLTHNQHTTNTQLTPNKNVKNDKNILDISNRPVGQYGNPKIETLLKSFQETKGFPPTDKDIRRVTWNFVQRIDTAIKKLGYDPNEANFNKIVGKLFGWYSTNDWFQHIEKMETLKLKSVIFLAKIGEKNDKQAGNIGQS